MFDLPPKGSAYLGPGSPMGDREKPEVVAPAQNITTLEINNAARTDSGTSYAAPQAAGLAALLLQRNWQLDSRPTVLKAILMASAIHNIEGSRDLSSRDGAGSIDATLADRIAQNKGTDGVTCSGPCWWYIGTQSNYPNVGGTLYEQFQVSRGERVRVAIAWWSLADPPPSDMSVVNDVLATDFQLSVRSPSNILINSASSSSWDNNYEILDFVAGETGTYRIEIYKRSASESTNELGIAWVKDATYLPDLSNNTSWRPWTSRIYVRNEGTQYQNADVTYFNAQGQFTIKDTCGLAPRQWCEIPINEGRVPLGQRASAIISGGEELSVQVVNVNASGPFAFDSYTGIRQGATTALHAPLLHRNLWDLWSKMVVHNTGAQDARIQIQYVARVGTGCLTPVFTVPKNGSKEFDLRHDMGCSSPPGQFQGAAQIRNLDARPLTGVVIDTKDIGQDGVLELRRSYELIFDGRSPAYVPNIQRNSGGRNTGLYVKDMSYLPESVLANYRNSSSGVYCGPDSAWLDSNGTAAFSPSPSDAACPPAGSVWTGSAAIDHQGIAVVANHADPGAYRASMYAAINQPGRSVIVPFVLQNTTYLGLSGWTTRVRVQNTSSTDSATAKLWYYSAGGQLSIFSTMTILPRSAMTFGTGGLSNFAGSAVIEASQPIAVSTSYDLTSPSDNYDYNMSMTGVHR